MDDYKMKRFISLLRGINVGGQNKLSMETLRQTYEALGFRDVRTYIQSGNVIFVADEGDRAKLVRRIEAAIEVAMGNHVPVFIRQVQELKQILANNPFLTSRNTDQNKLYVSFLYQPAPEAAWSKLAPPAGTQDEFARGEGVIYLFCPNGYGKAKLSNTFFERTLGIPITTRNWNTVNALYKMGEG